MTAAIGLNMILKMMYQFTFTELFSWVTWMKLQVLTSDHSLTAFSTLTLVSVTTVTYPLVSTLTSCSCSLSWLLLARSSSSETVSRVVTIPKPLIRNQGHASSTEHSVALWCVHTPPRTQLHCGPTLDTFFTQLCSNTAATSSRHTQPPQLTAATSASRLRLLQHSCVQLRLRPLPAVCQIFI